jgi:hypothetical protein
MGNKKRRTLFACDGSIRIYKGRLLELYSQISQPEWDAIVEETVKYKVFLECLRDNISKIGEEWTKKDDRFISKLESTISDMSDIDRFAVAKFNQNEIKESYSSNMNLGIEQMNFLIKSLRHTSEVYNSEI